MLTTEYYCIMYMQLKALFHHHTMCKSRQIHWPKQKGANNLSSVSSESHTWYIFVHAQYQIAHTLYFLL